MGNAPRIGIFDSGIGGLSVATAIRQALPMGRLLYFGDNAHVPYGERTENEILAFSKAITAALLAKGCDAIVIACNTASSAALSALREQYPTLPIVGMEPAVKPAVEHTRTGVVGVLATRATVDGRVLADVVERFAQDVKVIRQACPGLAQRIDAGDFDGPTTEAMLRGWITPMLEQGIDALVLGCTHYPLVRPLIERITGPTVRVIEPSEAIARRLKHLLEVHGLIQGSEDLKDPLQDHRGNMEDAGLMDFYTSGDPASFRKILDRLGSKNAAVEQGIWEDDGSLWLP